MPPVTDRLIALEHLRLNIRQWPGDKRPFLLVHGLASNARTWDAVHRHTFAPIRKPLL